MGSHIIQVLPKGIQEQISQEHVKEKELNAITISTSFTVSTICTLTFEIIFHDFLKNTIL